MATAESAWREDILNKLQERNRFQTNCFQELIAQHNKIFDTVNVLKHENLQLSIQNEKLRLEGDGPGSSDSKLYEKIQYLEQKLLNQQEELTELHRRKGENSQQIIDLNAKLQEKEKLIVTKDISLAENTAKITSLQAEITLFDRNNKELKLLNEALRDEHQALHLAFTCLEDKLRKLQDENRQLLDRLMKYKTKDADRMNEENENFLKKRFAKMQKEIEEACRDMRGVSPEELQEGYGPTYQSTIPTKASVKFDAHDGEVNAVKWSPVDRLVATGGADRKVKLWEISKGAFESRGMLVGSNAGVMAVDFDTSGTLILGASNDYASRVWTVSDQRLRIPTSQEEWIDIERSFFQQWNFPHCCGAIDGKHVQIQRPPNSGSEFYNYKGTYSIILFALVDADYCFKYIEVGANGRANDSTIFRNSDLNKAMLNGSLHLTNDSVIIGDDAFPLRTNLLKPYSGSSLTIKQRIFNYRLSRARRVVENAFGILSSRFRIFRGTINLKSTSVDLVIKTCCALHNWLRITSGRMYIPQGSVDREDTDAGVVVDGSWRTEVDRPLQPIKHLGINNYSQAANQLRDQYAEYFSGEGTVPWQNRMIGL